MENYDNINRIKPIEMNPDEILNQRKKSRLGEDNMPLIFKPSKYSINRESSYLKMYKNNFSVRRPDLPGLDLKKLSVRRPDDEYSSISQKYKYALKNNNMIEDESSDDDGEYNGKKMYFNEKKPITFREEKGKKIFRINNLHF